MNLKEHKLAKAGILVKIVGASQVVVGITELESE